MPEYSPLSCGPGQEGTAGVPSFCRPKEQCGAVELHQLGGVPCSGRTQADTGQLPMQKIRTALESGKRGL